ncbi:hypothetical protein HMPREF1487_08118 [Pseudomonas sp. HPB0071]|uniref:DUF4198 domain-containing protein n=2 Tax=Pseudomonas TaxID=286 RepID=A0A2X2CKM3_PSELU|nr:hypothetical protein HMPREF1487_08118 [Pseudomonas sp. HPB0071]MBA1247569.1 DUF4198 domain-containing protein [Pseudomonas zeshuii]QEU29100.1 DUF4198 domain-containing protein [Pseudomonas luteola]MBF8640834.1 DUF4198 domain-containing protein [Pseudomonas zeshuii]RRW45869.1 DUF4198 domain-containing protein [Pseudomonas luteola]
MVILRNALLCIGLGSVVLNASAHELWLERDASGPIRVYLGEPDEGVLETGETIAALAPTTQVFTHDRNATAKVVAREDHLEAAVNEQGDVRSYNDQVWKPWKDEQGHYTAALMHARAGRTETKALLDYELVPAAANSNRFTLLFKGKPLAEHDVVLFDPKNQALKLKTDSQGVVDVPAKEKGRFILASGYQTPANGYEVAGQKMDNLYYGTTTSFIVD